MAAATHPNFRVWLTDQFAETGIARRELARRLAAKHPQGVTPATIDTNRRAIYRYLDEANPMIPTQQTRVAFAEAFGVDPATVPSEDDDEESQADLDASLRLIAVQRAELSRIERQLRALKREGVGT